MPLCSARSCGRFSAEMQKRIFVVSDIHYACPAEQARRDHEIRVIENPLLRRIVRFYRYHFWLRDPYNQNHLLDQFLNEASEADFVVSNGDHTVNTAFHGVLDDAACQSAAECLGKLRSKFGENFRATFGDHELGKFSLFGGRGGLRLGSWRRAVNELCIQPFWRMEMGSYVLLGVTSTLLALPIYEQEAFPEEWNEWKLLRESHLNEIRENFAVLKPDQRVILFCHDPTALPFLRQEEVVRQKISQIEQTIIGHLHSPLIYWKSQRLSGIPRITFMGNSIRRYSTALNEARHWREFHVRLCPSTAGIELLKDGGYLVLTIDTDGKQPIIVERKHLKR